MSPNRQSTRAWARKSHPPLRHGVKDASGRPKPLVPAPADHRMWAVERWLAGRFLRAMNSPPIGFVLWDGREISPSAQAPVARVVFHDRATFWKVMLDPDLRFGDAYSDGRLDVAGDLVVFLEAIHRARAAAPDTWSAALLRGLHRGQANTLHGARDNIHRHYDIGDDFYRLWLDGEMLYSGAYFADAAMTLEDAQRAKLHYVCRKLWLRPGETVVEVGGGWGALALLLARDYGVTVKSFNISRSQIAWARRRAKAEGLDSRVEFVEDDYRNITGRFDALVSLGMLEHVGARYYREFGRMMDRCLGPTGRGLIQSIGQDQPTNTNPWIERRIFPGAYPPTLREMTDLFEPWRFSVLDVENLRLHYAQTLRHWLQRFEASAGRVAEMFDARFVRAWRLYLAGSCAAFAGGALQLFQVVFARQGVNDIPSTRARLYA
jgi:cyclopropane-fatty-acyl-phospholipid synthase